jgi:hypothetical protein
MSETFVHDSELPSELCDDSECEEHHPSPAVRLARAADTDYEAVGKLLTPALMRVWGLTGRPDLATSAGWWDAFGLAVAAALLSEPPAPVQVVGRVENGHLVPLDSPLGRETRRTPP